MIKNLTTTEVGMLMSTDTIIRDAQVMVRKCMINGFIGASEKIGSKWQLQADLLKHNSGFWKKLCTKRVGSKLKYYDNSMWNQKGNLCILSVFIQSRYKISGNDVMANT
jgi:hypothetical protein